MVFSRVARIKIHEVRPFLDEMVSDLQEMRDDIADEVGRSIMEEAKFVTSERLPSGGGSYINSFAVEKTDKGNTRIVNFHPWARAIEYGTRPRTFSSPYGMDIDPTFLPDQMSSGQSEPVTPSFGTPYGGGRFYAKSITHPGSRPFMVLWEARNRVMRDSGRYNRIIDNAFRKRGWV